MTDDASLSPASSPSTSTSSRTERDYLGDSQAHNDRPQTPQYGRGQTELHNAFSPMSSPQLPSPMTMNLYRLGIGSSPFQRQLSSSFTNQSASPVAMSQGATDADDELSERDLSNRDRSSNEHDEDDDGLTQDSKDVLLDRLGDLLKQLSTGGSLDGDNITTLHAKVDEMEKVLASDHRRQKQPRPKTLQQRSSILQLASPLPIVRSHSGAKSPEEQAQPDYWGFSRTPPRRQLAPVFAQLSSRDGKSEDMSLTNLDTRRIDGLDESDISTEVADSLVVEAEKLCTELNAVVKNLQDRREESDHVHEMLVDRAEAAAKRILELDDYVSVLEDEISTNKSETEHLRLQLRALEVLCYEYVPPDADRDLLQSIENWKSDYTRLKLKMAARRRERNPPSAAASPSASTVLSPSTSALLERAGRR